MSAAGAGGMVPRTPRMPNGVLRGIRENERHESRSQFAEAMARLARDMGVEVYPDEKYVQRLESGCITWPHRTYRAILEQLCGRPDYELGFAPSQRTTAEASSRVNTRLREAVWESGLELSVFARKIGVDPKTAERWITRGVIPQPHRRWKAALILGIDEGELWPDVIPYQENLRRKPEAGSRGRIISFSPTQAAMPHAGQPAVSASKSNSGFSVVVAGDGLGLSLEDEERIIHAIRRPMRADSNVTIPLKKILAAQRETEDIIGAAPLIKPVNGQIATLEDLVAESRGPARPQIIDVAAQWAEYSGWLHTSIGHWQEARGCFDRASEWAIEAGNATLSATSLSFKGHIAFLRGQIGPMIGLTEAAFRNNSSWVGQRAYDAHQLARGLALAGDFNEAIRNVETGTELALLADEQSEDRPPWIYYYTLPFYALERGMVYRFLGRDDAACNEEAIASLTAALNEIGASRSSEWAADYIYHLAIAYMQAGAPDKASETALEVLRIARATESKGLMKRLGGIHARLVKQWPDDPHVKELGIALR